MKKLVRYGLLLLVVSLISLLVFLVCTPSVFANEEEAEEGEESEVEAVVTSEEITPAEKAAAIKAANDAISKIPAPNLIVSYEQSYINQIANAFALVERAKNKYGAEDSDFPELARLYEAEVRVMKMYAIQNARDAIDLIPPKDQITEEHREVIEEARRLVNVAMNEYGATPFEICWRYDKLKEAEDALPDEEPAEPKPEKPKPKPDDRRPTPPTGGLTGLVGLGTFLSVAGLAVLKKQRR